MRRGVDANLIAPETAISIKHEKITGHSIHQARFLRDGYVVDGWVLSVAVLRGRVIDWFKLKNGETNGPS
ncbi:MAG TPA: hypothetical protein DD457_01115 [Gammaproteobacteria bacterium]|nr:hypothetical protein [Gammaproteobacteria bacterium]